MGTISRWVNERSLHSARSHRTKECVKRLLKAGADPTLEFSSFAKVMLEMDDEMTAIIETARKKWNR